MLGAGEAGGPGQSSRVCGPERSLTGSLALTHISVVPPVSRLLLGLRSVGKRRHDQTQECPEGEGGRASRG